MFDGIRLTIENIRKIADNPWDSYSPTCTFRQAIVAQCNDLLSILEPASDELIDEARAIFQGSEDEIQIDRGACTAGCAKGGTWVQAWVWVPGDEEE